MQIHNTLWKTDAGFVQRGYLPLKDLKERKVKDGKIVGGEQRRANGSKLPLSESFDER